MCYLTSPAVTDAYFLLPGVLLAEQELTHEPVKATIIGGKDDAQAAALHLEAFACPTEHKRMQ